MQHNKRKYEKVSLNRCRLNDQTSESNDPQQLNSFFKFEPRYMIQGELLGGKMLRDGGGGGGQAYFRDAVIRLFFRP